MTLRVRASPSRRVIDRNSVRAQGINEMYLIVDCETTGLPKNWNAPIADLNNWPRVIQVAWSRYDKTNRHLESVVHLIQPDGFTIPAEAQRIHGITTARALAEGKELLDVLRDLNSAIEASEILVAHNLKFDERVLSAEFLRMNLQPPFLNRKRFCTMENTTELCRIPSSRGYKWPTLAQLHWELFKSKPEEAHDAGADVATCAKCFFELKRREIVSV
jgi:DNA polymerase-3 subunit epsilon